MPSSSRIDCAATGKARRLPEGHAQVGRFGAPLRLQGIKVRVSGRLNGNEIAVRMYLQGRLPLHTLRAISITIHRGAHDLWHHRREVLGLQGEILPRRSAKRRGREVSTTERLESKKSESDCRIESEVRGSFSET